MLEKYDLRDIYLGDRITWLSGVPGHNGPFPAPPECAPELEELKQLCRASLEESQRDEFAVRHKGVSYRASILKSLSDMVFVLRRMPNVIPDINSLNIHSGYIEHLMRPGISGLIVIAGAFGQGKTTTASSLIVSRLKAHGGIGISIEDPPEMPLEGAHGNGVCYQTWVDKGGFAEGCRKAARYTPDIIFLGEVRDSETATEALRASINGRLVICTVHSDTVVQAVERLYSLANGVAGNSDDTSSLLASGLLGVLHQRLEGEPKSPKIEFIWFGGAENQGVRNTIRLRRFEQIGSEINLQLNRMLMGQKKISPQIDQPTDRRRTPRE